MEPALPNYQESSQRPDVKPSTSRSRADAQNKPVPTALRYRKGSLYLLGCYIVILLVPWVLTCILAVRPLNKPSYYNQKGEYGPDVLNAIRFWNGFVRVLNAIASLITVPVISALLAHGAVVYSQRRKIDQTLNLRQTFTLADRGWADVPSLWKALWKNGAGSRYLWLGAALLTLGNGIIFRRVDISLTPCRWYPSSTSASSGWDRDHQNHELL